MPLLPGLKCKKKSKTDTQAKQLSANEPENESQEAPQAEEAPQQQRQQHAPQTEEAPQQQQQQQQQQAPQTEEAPQQQQQQAPQTEEAPQQQAPPPTVTPAPSEPQPERINYEHYNQFIAPYRMEDDLEMGAIEFQRQVTKWMRIPPYS